jgi:hypothetical protein
MRCRSLLILFASAVMALPSAFAGISVDYTADGGGNNSDPLNGLSARATYELAGTHLTILLENTSTGLPSGFDTAASLLVSLGFNLPDGVMFAAGNSSVIGTGGYGLGQWSGRTAGDSVGEEWVWSNSGSGDLLESYDQILSTHEGAKNAVRFDGGSGSIGGPYGGIATDAPLMNIPASQYAVAGSILFDLTLTDTLTAAQLSEAAHGALVEFGSDDRYLSFNPVPTPGSILLGVIGLAMLRRRVG